MLRGIVCLLLAPVFMMSAPVPDDALPELRIDIMSIGAGANPKYSASLERIQDHRRVGAADLAPDGALRFRDVPYGEYRLTITGGDGQLVYKQGLAVNSSTHTVMVNLPVTTKSPSVSGTVSVFQLGQPVQKKAVSALRASQKRFDRGDYEGAVEELDRAIAASPGYADAYASLGAVHIKLRLYEQALNEIAQALSIAGPNARDLSNMALADYNLGLFRFNRGRTSGPAYGPELQSSALRFGRHTGNGSTNHARVCASFRTGGEDDKQCQSGPDDRSKSADPRLKPHLFHSTTAKILAP
jgi:TPR repeat